MVLILIFRNVLIPLSFKKGRFMKRKISIALNEWKNKPNRMPLVIGGARQVGKTYVIKGFGEMAFDTMIFIDFEKMPKA